MKREWGPAAQWLLWIIGGYLLGSMHFCRWIPRLCLKKDICALSDDGNPGAVNVFRHCGAGWGLFCLCFDLAKGFFPLFLATRTVDSRSWPFALVMAGPALGHAFSLFDRFRGGKCIAVIFGELLGLFPVTPVFWVLAVLYIVFSLLRINPRRRRSILTFSVFAPLAAALELVSMRSPSVAVGCVILATVAIYKHWAQKEGQNLNYGSAKE